MNRLLVRIFVALMVVAVAIQFVPVKRTNPETNPNLEIQGSMIDVLARSCFDCHSHHASWPWYSRVAPVSWALSHHVEEGREKLNFSLWQQYSEETRRHLAAEAVVEIDQDEMPLPIHLLLHRNARISSPERDRLAAWSLSLRETPTGDDRDEEMGRNQRR